MAAFQPSNLPDKMDKMGWRTVAAANIKGSKVNQQNRTNRRASPSSLTSELQLFFCLPFISHLLPSFDLRMDIHEFQAWGWSNQLLR